jgi:hypothetical protein
MRRYAYLCTVPSVASLADCPLVPSEEQPGPQVPTFWGFGRKITIGGSNRSGTTVLKRLLIAVSVTSLISAMRTPRSTYVCKYKDHGFGAVPATRASIELVRNPCASTHQPALPSSRRMHQRRAFGCHTAVYEIVVESSVPRAVWSSRSELPDSVAAVTLRFCAGS